MNYTKITQRSSSLGRRVRGAPWRPRASMLSQARKRKLRSVDRVGGQTRPRGPARVREGPGSRRRRAARQRRARNVRRGVARPQLGCIQSVSRVRKSWQRGTRSQEGASEAVDHDHRLTIGLLGRVAACRRPQVRRADPSRRDRCALCHASTPSKPLRTSTRPSSTCTCWSSFALHRELEVVAAAPLPSSVRPCTKGSMHGHRRAVTRMQIRIRTHRRHCPTCPRLRLGYATCVSGAHRPTARRQWLGRARPLRLRVWALAAPRPVWRSAYTTRNVLHEVQHPAYLACIPTVLSPLNNVGTLHDVSST